MEHGIERRSAHTKFSKDFNLNSHSQNYTTRLKCSDELRTSAKVSQTYIKPLPTTHKAENDNNNWENDENDHYIIWHNVIQYSNNITNIEPGKRIA